MWQDAHHAASLSFSHDRVRVAPDDNEPAPVKEPQLLGCRVPHLRSDKVHEDVGLDFLDERGPSGAGVNGVDEGHLRCPPRELDGPRQVGTALSRKLFNYVGRREHQRPAGFVVGSVGDEAGDPRVPSDLGGVELREPRDRCHGQADDGLAQPVVERHDPAAQSLAEAPQQLLVYRLHLVTWWVELKIRAMREKRSLPRLLGLSWRAVPRPKPSQTLCEPSFDLRLALAARVPLRAAKAK